MGTPATAQDALKEHDEQCKSAISAFKRELQKMRTGRASASLIEGISVDYYGSKTPLPRLGQISTPEPRMIVLQVFDANAVAAVDKAIRSAGLGLNPSRDGNTLRISVPPLNEETRKEIVRHLHKMAEDIRVSIRNHRRDANDAVKKFEKDGTVAKDEAKKVLDRVQKQTDGAMDEVEKLLKAKEAECMEV